MSPEEIYQKALDIAQEALAGAERKVEKLVEHLDSAKGWLDEAQTEAQRLEELGLDGFLAEVGIELPAEQPAAESGDGSGAAGAAALNASAKTVDGA